MDLISARISRHYSCSTLRKPFRPCATTLVVSLNRLRLLRPPKQRRQRWPDCSSSGRRDLSANDPDCACRTRGITSSAKRCISASNGWNCSMNNSISRRVKSENARRYLVVTADQPCRRPAIAANPWRLLHRLHHHDLRIGVLFLDRLHRRILCSQVQQSFVGGGSLFIGFPRNDKRGKAETERPGMARPRPTSAISPATSSRGWPLMNHTSP